MKKNRLSFFLFFFYKQWFFKQTFSKSRSTFFSFHKRLQKVNVDTLCGRRNMPAQLRLLIKSVWPPN